MASEPLTTESIALTEKKMGMTLEDIIKMSKKPTAKGNTKRASNKSQKPFKNNSAGQGNPQKMKRFMDSRALLRQGELNKRRSNFQGNQFSSATEAARKAITAPVRNRPFNRTRMPNWNKPRVGGIPQVQKRNDAGFGAGKRQNQQGKVAAPKQTLDSLFANMKEQRMRMQQQNMARNAQPRQQQRGRGGGGARFGNNYAY